MKMKTAEAIALAQERAAIERMMRDCGEYSTAYLLGVFRQLYTSTLIDELSEADGTRLLRRLKSRNEYPDTKPLAHALIR